MITVIYTHLWEFVSVVALTSFDGSEQVYLELNHYLNHYLELNH